MVPLILPLLLAASVQATATPDRDHHAAACPSAPVALPAALHGWDRQRPVTAAASATRPTAIAIGEGVRAALSPTPRVTYAVAPEKPGPAASHGGVFAFAVTVPGRYRVALGAGAWIDVLSGATPVASAAHGHGPACGAVRKMVDFDLKPGRYLLQIAGATDPALLLMVARLG